ncbi:hypothetical protein LOZ66_001429 [Ophidiomyces ophidiicola]|nr:hypothetical protein LOZ66_001429 [Ophidiomyces ophidiicola]
MRFIIALGLFAASTVSAESKFWEKAAPILHSIPNPVYSEWQKELDKLSGSQQPVPVEQLAALIDITGSLFQDLAQVLEESEPLQPGDIKGICDNAPQIMDLTVEKVKATGAFGLLVKSIGQDKFLGGAQMRHALQHFQSGFQKTTDALKKRNVDCSGTLPSKITAADKELKETISEWQK